MDVDLDGLFSLNGSYDYDESYEYKDDFDHRHANAAWIQIWFSLLTVLGLLGNGLLMAALGLKRKSTWTVSDTFVFNQGVADILLLVTLPFWAAQASRACGWCFAGVLCKINGAVFNLNFFCGVLLLVCICLDRCISIVHDRVLLSAKKPKLTLICCVVVWGLSLVLSIPDWLFNGDFKEPSPAKTLCIFRHPRTSVHWLMLSRIRHHMLGFVLPAATLIVCCSWVLLQLNRSVKGFQKHRYFVAVTTLVVVFLLCWVPYNVALMVDTSRSERKADSTSGGSLEVALLATSAIGCVHACLRPVLYLVLSANFRNWCISMLRCTTADAEGSLCELGVGGEARADRSQEQQEEEEQRVPMTDCVADQQQQVPSAPC